jgi:lipoate-protein ligase A
LHKESYIQEYKLPDAVLMQESINPSVLHFAQDEGKSYRYLVWRPDKIYIVLGNSNQVEEAVFLERAIKDEVPILKRPTGGQSVVLSPQMVVVSTAKKGRQQMFSRKYLLMYNGRIIEALKQIGICDLEMQGISDITLRGQKIAGSAMYRNIEMVFFHAVLNVAESAHLIERYLRYPPITPQYRAGRTHLEFITSLRTQGFAVSFEETLDSIKKQMEVPLEEFCKKTGDAPNF